MTESEKLIFDIHAIVGKIHTKLEVQENEVKHITKKVDAHDKDITTLVAAHNEIIGKRTVLTTIFGAIGGGIIALIHFFSK